MLTNPDLAALSAAATPGEWLVEPDMRIDTRYTPDREEYEYLAGYNVMGDVEVIGCEGIIPGGQAEANAAFIVALVNAYRTGNLVQIDRVHEATARAEAAEAKCVKLWALLDDMDTLDDACRGEDDLFRTLTRAAQQKRHAIMSGEEWDTARAELAARKPRETLKKVARREVKAAGYEPGYLGGQAFENGFLRGVQMQKEGVLPDE